jgi:hypothetical protein
MMLLLFFINLGLSCFRAHFSQLSHHGIKLFSLNFFFYTLINYSRIDAAVVAFKVENQGLGVGGGGVVEHNHLFKVDFDLG